MNRWTPRFGALLLVAPLGSAPASDQRDQGPRIDTLPSGRVVVTNQATGIWRPEQAWRVVEETRLGRVEDEGPDLFGYVVAVALDRFQRIWVLDRYDQEIRVFERDGRHVRSFGRKGGGPGEFQDALGMAFGPGERLWVVDSQRGRITVFDTLGAVLTTHRTRGGHSVMPWPGGFDRNGNFYDTMADSADVLRHLVARYDSAFRLTTIVRPPRWEDPGAVIERVSPDGRSRSRSMVPFSPRAFWALTPDGDFWALHTGRYQLDRISPRGDTLRTVTMPARPIPVSDTERNAAIGIMRRNPGPPDERRVPRMKPPVAALFVADDGHLWIAKEGLGLDRFRQADVFDPDGRYLGPVDLPFQLMAPVVFRGDHVATVVWGPMGVHFVSLARVVKP